MKSYFSRICFLLSRCSSQYLVSVPLYWRTISIFLFFSQMSRHSSVVDDEGFAAKYGIGYRITVVMGRKNVQCHKTRHPFYKNIWHIIHDRFHNLSKHGYSTHANVFDMLQIQYTMCKTHDFVHSTTKTYSTRWHYRLVGRLKHSLSKSNLSKTNHWVVWRPPECCPGWAQ